LLDKLPKDLVIGILKGVATSVDDFGIGYSSLNLICDLAQGFFFDRPLPVADFEERLATHHYTID